MRCRDHTKGYSPLKAVGEENSLLSWLLSEKRIRNAGGPRTRENVWNDGKNVPFKAYMTTVFSPAPRCICLFKTVMEGSLSTEIPWISGFRRRLLRLYVQNSTNVTAVFDHDIEAPVPVCQAVDSRELWCITAWSWSILGYRQPNYVIWAS